MAEGRRMGNTALLATLRKEIAAQGWGHKATGRILGELLIHISLAIAGTVVFVTANFWWARVCGLVVLSAGSLGVGTNTHTSSHYGASDKRWVNEWLTYFGFPFFLGLSASFWRYSHITIHHPAPNVIGVDDDADLSPWFAMTEAEVARSSGFRRWYYEKLQWVFLPLALAGNGFNYFKSGWLHLIRALRDPARRKRAHWIDLGALIAHQVLYLGIPLYFFSVRETLGFYMIRSVALGYGMFLVLAPGHFPAEARRLSSDLKDADYELMQTANTIDFRAGWIGRLLSSGLGYQIEHHLFPNLSHVHYRKMAPLIERLCRENGLPYRAYSWDQVIWKCWMVFRSPRPLVSDVETLRTNFRTQQMVTESQSHRATE
jgi:linoleoyl-CoA desaturase